MGKFYNLTPREIVAELDKYIVGQDGAKKIGGDRSAKQTQTESAFRRDARGSHAEKYPDDGSYRLR